MESKTVENIAAHVCWYCDIEVDRATHVCPRFDAGQTPSINVIDPEIAALKQLLTTKESELAEATRQRDEYLQSGQLAAKHNLALLADFLSSQKEIAELRQSLEEAHIKLAESEETSRQLAEALRATQDAARLEPQPIAAVPPANPMIAEALALGHDTTGLCTVRDFAEAIMENPIYGEYSATGFVPPTSPDSKGVPWGEMTFTHKGKRYTVEMVVTKAEEEA